jgi:hypothetical protein
MAPDVMESSSSLGEEERRMGCRWCGIDRAAMAPGIGAKARINGAKASEALNTKRAGAGSMVTANLAGLVL